VLQVISLVDQCGRRITRLRLAINEACNFKCIYCRPREDESSRLRGSLLSVEELVRVAEACVASGISCIRLTGGEPLLRPKLPEIIRRISGLSPDLDISLTTNGYHLGEMAEALAGAGLQRINVSLDSLRKDSFCEMTGSHSVETVIAGIRAAYQAGLRPMKVNVVVIRGLNDAEITDMVEFARENAYHIRFIEFMPLDGRQEWSPEKTVPVAEIRAQIEQRYELTPLLDSGSPGDEYLLGKGPTRVSLIGAVSKPFCNKCNRMRVTADGFLRLCLFSLEELDLRPALADSHPKEALMAAFAGSVAGKPMCHNIGKEGFVSPARPMSAIGG
jgi:cyclic pyranopterin phosphate synthase